MQYFDRFEKKYLPNQSQYDALMELIQSDAANWTCDEYLVRNIYYDTDDYSFIRRSVDKPVYKEKLRLRCYGDLTPDSVYLELKKKYKGIVYKRRMSVSYDEERVLIAAETLGCAANDSPVAAEIRHLTERHRLVAKAHISYFRQAFTYTGASDLRVTFDSRLLFRLDGFSFTQGEGGTQILDDDRYVMEIKTLTPSFPMQLTSVLSRLEIYPTSFSKYGTCYVEHIANDTVRKEYLINA